MNTYVDMYAKFLIFEKNENGQFELLKKDDIQDLFAGGFTFEIDGKSIPFDFEASAVNYTDGIFYYESGQGSFFNAHYLDDVFDEIYELKKVKRNELTAAVLASATGIEEFFVNFWDNDETEFGIGDNLEIDPDLRIEIIEIGFSDENANCFNVSPDVIRKFNAGNGGETYGL